MELTLRQEAAEKEVIAKEAEEKATVKGKVCIPLQALLSPDILQKLKSIFTSDAEEAAEHERLVSEAVIKRREAEEARRKEHSISTKIKEVFDHDNEVCA
jgi:hypothetical protein